MDKRRNSRRVGPFLRQTETALSAYARERDRNVALARAREDAARAADQAGRLYRFGRTDFLSLLTAQASLTTAEASLSASTRCWSIGRSMSSRRSPAAGRADRKKDCLSARRQYAPTTAPADAPPMRCDADAASNAA